MRKSVGRYGMKNLKTHAASPIRAISIILVGSLTLVAAAPSSPQSPNRSADRARDVGGKSSAVAATVAPVDESLNVLKRTCRPQAYDSNSELCAQWYAALAARDGARWSFHALWISGVAALISIAGLVGLLRSLSQTDRTLRLAHKERAAATRRALASDKHGNEALKIAHDANQLAAQHSQDANRPWVSLHDLQIGNVIDFVGGRAHTIREVRISFTYKTLGNLPATHCVMTGTWLADNGSDEEVAEVLDHKLAELMADSDIENKGRVILFPAMSGNGCVNEYIPGRAYRDWANRNCRIIILLFARYRFPGLEAALPAKETCFVYELIPEASPAELLSHSVCAPDAFSCRLVANKCFAT